MSDAATAIADEGTIDPKPLADTSSVETEAAAKPPEADPDPAKPSAMDELKETIKRMAFDGREAKRQAAQYREQLDRLTPKPEPGAAPSDTELERMVNERAEAILQRRDGDDRTSKWQAAGTAEYPDWNDKCNALADMGAADNKAFIHAVTAVPNGHRVVAELYENPDQMLKLLRMQPIEMAIALAGMGSRLSSAAPATASTPTPMANPVSRAPPPIRPITATARAEASPEKMSESEYQAYWNKRTRGG